MRQRFKARELWLLAPFLLMSVLTFCFGRVERVWAQDAGGVIVSDVKIETTQGLLQHDGWSRQITMKVSYPLPRPKWWGKRLLDTVNLDPVDFEHPKFPPYDPSSENWIAGGGAFLVKHDGKSVVWRPKDFATNFRVVFDGKNYIFTHQLRNSELDKVPGEISFHGIYRIADDAPFEVTSVIRRADQTLPPVPDKNTGGKLLSVDALPFQQSTRYQTDKAPIVSDECQVFFLVRRATIPDDMDWDRGLRVEDLKVRDQNGKIYQDYAPKGFIFGYGLTIDSTSDARFKPYEGEQLRPGEALIFISINIAPTTLTSGDLTLSGNISIDMHWPIPFEIKLPARALSSRENVGVRRWKRPASVPLR